MTHEPECPCSYNGCKRPANHCDDCWCMALRIAYRRGYNDHARAAATGYQMFGIPANQHGIGENP